MKTNFVKLTYVLSLIDLLGYFDTQSNVGCQFVLVLVGFTAHQRSIGHKVPKISVN